MLKDLVSKSILVNKCKAKGDSYEIIRESQNKIENHVVLSDTELEINHEGKTPTKNTFSNVDLSFDSITKSISNLTAEVTAIKNFIINRVRTEQIDQTKVDKSNACGHSCRKESIPKHTVTIDSHHRNKFVEKEIPMSYNKFNCLNIGKDVVITNG